MTVPLYNLTDTWNNGATVFSAIKMNVTDTASDATSLLLDLQIASTTKFSVNKTGGVLAGDYSAFGATAAIVDDTIIQIQHAPTVAAGDTYWGIHIDIDGASGGAGASLYGIEVTLDVPNTSTGDFGDYFALTFFSQYHGVGDVNRFRGVQGAITFNNASAAVTGDMAGGFFAGYAFAGDMTGADRIVGAFFETFDGTAGGGCPLIAGVYVAANEGFNITAGVYIADQSANGGTANYSFVTKGATARGLIEGLLQFGTGTNSSPANGDVWFDGTNLKLRTGGTTKTITAV